MADDTVAELAKAAQVAARRCAAEDAARPVQFIPRPYDRVVDFGDALSGNHVVPPTDGLILSREEAALVAAGWRFLAIPTFRRRASLRRLSLASPLDWSVRMWLAVPPETTAEAARRFAKKSAALAWAKSQHELPLPE